MIHYIYFVKCQDCEDEHFDFFADAKAHAVSCLDLHPIITQVEVDRNDFGECVASKDLGTVWSWEEVMNDAEVTDETTFSKADTLGVDIDNDPEFLAIDNSLEEDAYTRDLAKRLKSLTSDSDAEPKSKKPLFDKDKHYVATWKVVQATFPNLTVKDGFTSEVEAANYVRDHGGLSKLKTVKNESFERKAIPEDMTIKDLVEAMEENEDQVECVGCEELYDKTECTHLENHGWLCPDCQDTVVECSWCHELFDTSECREEVDLGYLCGQCESAIKSRGETLTFREELEGNTSALTEATTLTPQQKDEIMCCVAVSFETGHQAFEDFRDFKREYPELSSDVLQMLWAYYNDLVAMGPAGFYEQFKDVYDFDPMFVAEYGDMVEESFDHISDFKNNLLACPECGKNAFDSETEICLECGSGPLSEDFLRNK